MKLLSKRELGLFVGLVVLVGVSWQWLQKTDAVVNSQTLQEQEEVDGYLKHFVITAMNKEGQPNHRLEADKMVLFSGTRLSQVEKPFLTLYRGDENPWLIRAEHGLVQTGVDVVFLTGNVRMTQEDLEGNITEVLTEKLEVQTRTHYALTEHTVTVNHSQGQATGIGMNAYLNEGRLSLLAQVRSYYAAPND